MVANSAIQSCKILKPESVKKFWSCFSSWTHFHYLFHFSYSDFDFLLFVVLMFLSFQFMKPFMRIMILICLCRTIVQQKLLSLISSQIHCQKLSLCQSPPNFGQDLTYVQHEFRLC